MTRVAGHLRARRVPRGGVTLLELLVTMAVLGIVAGVVSVTLRRLDEPAPDSPASRVARARREAVASGRPVTVTIDTMNATAWPDGSVVADSVLAVDRLSGRPAHASR